MLRTILLLYSLGRLCVTVLQTTGSMGCVLHTVLAVSLSVYVIVTMLQCWVLLLYSLHRVCVTVLQTILAAWAVSCQCVLNCYSVAYYTGCMGCILSVCVKLLQCCKLYWLHGLYPVSVCVISLCGRTYQTKQPGGETCFIQQRSPLFHQ